MKVPKPRKLKSGKWFIQLRLDGVSIPVTADTETECINQATLIKAEYKAGKRKARTAAGGETLGAVLDSYIKARSKVLSPSTIKAYKSIRKHRFSEYQEKKLSAIKNWQAVIDDEIDDGMKAKTVKNGWSLVCAALEHVGYPVPSVRLPKIVQAERPWLDADQVRIFVKALHGKKCEIPALLALHSLRRSEILGLTWDRVDLKKGTIRVEGARVFGPDGKLVYKETNKTKNSRRTVPIMIPELKKALQAIPEEARTGYVVTMHPTKMRETINAVCEANGLPATGVHGLRHSFASVAHHVGMPEQEAMLIGGWEDAQTMHKIYEHISTADRLKSENKIAEFFKNAS